MVSSLLGICRSTMPKLPFSLNTLTRKRAISPKAKPKSAPPRSRTCWMWSSEVMLRINSSVSSGRERRAFHAMQNTVQTDHRRQSHADVQVGGPFGDHQLQQIGH